MTGATTSNNHAPYEHLDEVQIQRTVQDLSAEIFIELLDHYFPEAKQRMQTIRTAIAQQDIEALEFEAHALGSSSANFGNKTMFVLCRKIEQAYIDKDIALAWATADELAAIANSTFEQLSQRSKIGF